MSHPPGRPCFPHLHLKARLPATLYADVGYELNASCTNEMDMWDSGDTEQWGNALPVVQLQVLHPHLHAVVTPPPMLSDDAATSSAAAAAASSSVSPSAGLASTPAAAAKLVNTSCRLTPDCKPLLSRAGKTSLKFTLSPSPVILARILSSHPVHQPLTYPFYLHISVAGPLGAKILPAVSGPHQLFIAPAKNTKAGQSQYVMGEHGVHHAMFVPLDSAPSAQGGKLPSVYSFPSSATSTAGPPAFIRFREILGVNLGGRIWDCGLLLFEYLRDEVLRKDPHAFHGKKILEVGSGTGLVGIWLWAYVLLKNRQAMSQAEAQGKKKPTIDETVFLLTDQEEAMENLHENLQTNLDLLSAGEKTMDGVTIEASQMSWGDKKDHAGLAIQPTPKPFDMILASDVVFNPIYFTPLLESLEYISGPNTRVLMAYRPRASDRKQDEVFFRALPKWGWQCKREGKYQDVFMLTLDRIPKEGENAAASAPVPSSTPPPAESAAATSSSAHTAVAAATPKASVPSTSEAATVESQNNSVPPSSNAGASMGSSSSTSPPAVDDDPFALALSLSIHSFHVGHASGLSDARLQMESDGLNAGRKQGEGVAGEMGFWMGVTGMMLEMRATRPDAYTPEVWSKCDRLHARLLHSPLRLSGFDPLLVPEKEEWVDMRNTFKTLMMQMKLWKYFQTQVETQAQQLSF